jgi:hypothetical protein
METVWIQDVKLEDGMYRLTDTGIAMHDSVC